MNRSGGRLTPTQKYATRRESPILLPHAESDTSLNRRGILSPHSADNVKDGKAPRNLVRYITETLIKKLAKEESLDQILSLNLTLSKEGGKKIKYIENLELLRRLQVLSLSCNIIEKIEKLDKLTKLRELNLSFNCITKIEGLENLVHLQVLNLTGNQIEHIPTWLAKKLKELQTFRIAKNKLATLQEISRLRPLKDMVQLNVSDNPLCVLPHSRLFIVFQLRTLEILDGQSVDIKERQAAQERFEQEEIENLADRLEKQEKKSRNLEEEKTKSLTEIKHKDERVDELKKKEKDSKRTIKELQKELETKDELLKRKTSELTKACQKHYRLEQELAFYKIDAKFESLGQFPQLSQSGDEGGLEESPYIGKARYKRSGTAGEKFLLNKAQPVTVQKLNYDEPDANPMNQQIKDRIHQALDNQLVDKEQNIGKAQERLLKLQDELHNTEQQILDATQELRRIAQATPQRPLTEEDKQQIRNRLAKKMRTVNTLRDRASEIEDEMGRTKHYMQREEKTIADLLIEMEKLGEDHPQYANVKAQVASRRQQLRLANDQYEALQRELDEMLARIDKETADIRKLEQQLQEGKAAANEQLKEELEGIIGGLTEYLNNVKQQATRQREDYDDLQREKDTLMEQLHQLEAEKSMMRYEVEEREKLQKRIDDLEKSLGEAQTLNESLRDTQNELSQRPDPEIEAKMKAALKEADKLRLALEEEQRKAQVEREATVNQLMREQQKVEQALREAQAMGHKEEEARNYTMQMAALQATNDSLKDRLRGQQKQIDEVLHNSIRPEDIVKRLHEMTVNLDDGDEITPYSDRDILGKTLSELQQQLKDKLKQSNKEKEQARKRQEKAEAEIKAMQNRLRSADEQYKQLTDKALQAKLSEQRKLHEDSLRRMQVDMKKLSDKIKEAEKRAAEEKEKAQKSPSPKKSDTPTPRKNPKDQERISQLEKDLSDIKKKYRDQEKQCAKKDSEAQAQIARLEGELRRRKAKDEEDKKKHEQERQREKERREKERRDKEKRTDEEKQKERKQKEREDRDRQKEKQREKEMKERDENMLIHPQARQAAKELLKAQDDIEKLMELLSEKERDLEIEIEEADKASSTVAAQQEEIDYLYDKLDEQKSEIRRLQEILDKFGGTLDADDDPEIAALMNEVDALKDALFEQSNRIVDISTPRGPSVRRVHYGNVVDEYQYSPPSSNWPPERNANFPHQHGPAYYPEDGGRYYSSPYAASPARYYPRSAGRGYGYANEPSSPTPPQGAAFAPVPGQAPLPAQPDFDASLTMPSGIPPGFAPVPPGYGTTNASYAAGVSTQPQVVLSGPPPATATTPSAASQPVIVTSTATSSGQTQQEILPRQIELPADMLFCNVPEHHDLEDEVTKLQKLLDKQSRRSEKKKKKPRGHPGSADSLLYDRLEDSLEEKREELDALDLAVERQKATLRRLKEDDAELKKDKEEALQELQRMRKTKEKEKDDLKTFREKELKRRDFLHGAQTYKVDDNEDDEEASQRKEDVVDEINCLERTLSKRRAELREADRLLHDCKADLKEARQKAKETIDRYDDAVQKFTNTRQDAEELERRAQETAEHLVIAEDELNRLQTDITELTQVKLTREDEIRKMNRIISSRNAEYKEIDQRTSAGPDRLHSDFREDRDTRQKIDTHHNELEDIDHEIGQRKADLQILQENIEKRKAELTHVLREGETDVAKKQRDIKKVQDILEELTVQNKDLEVTVSEKRSQLVKLRDCVDQEDETLQQLVSNVNKYKTELKHVLEMLQLEKTELEALKQHHTDKMIDLEKTQLAVIEEKSELERLQTEAQRKRTELERSKQIVEKEKADSERLVAERKSMQDHIDTLTKEKELLENNCSNLEGKICNLKKRQTEVEDETYKSKSKLEKTGQEAVQMEKELDEVSNHKSTMQRELQHLKHQIKESKNELKSTKKEITEAHEEKHGLEQDLRDSIKKKSDTAAELDRLQNMIEKSKDSLNECLTQERKKQDDLHKLLKDIDESRMELDEKKRSLQRIHAEIEREEHKQNRLIASLNIELETMNGDIQAKRDELEQTVCKFNNVRRDMDKLQLAKKKYESIEDKVGILSDQVITLENAVKEREEEKSRLAETLNYTHSEIKSLRNDKQECERQIAELKMELISAREQIQKTYTDFDSERKALCSEIEELESKAQDHCARANRLSEEINAIRRDYIAVKKQLRSQVELDEREKRLECSILGLKADIRNEVQDGLQNLELSRMEVLGELEQLHSQKEHLNKHLDAVHQNLFATKLESIVERDTDPQRAHSTALDDLSWRSEAMHERLAQEQDQLKLRLRQRFSHKADLLEDIRKKSESTLQNLKKKLENLEDLVTTNSRSYSSMTNGSFNGTLRDSDYFTRSQGISGFKHTGKSANGDVLMDGKTRSWITTSPSELIMPSFHELQSQDEILHQDLSSSPSTSPSMRRHGYTAKRPNRSRSAERLSPTTDSHMDERLKEGSNSADQRMKLFMESVSDIGRNEHLDGKSTNGSGPEH